MIKALDHVAQCFSAQDGLMISHALAPQLAAGKRVTVSLTGVGDITSSFANAAFVSLLDGHDMAYLRDHLFIVDASKQAGDMIRRCFQNAVRERVAA